MEEKDITTFENFLSETQKQLSCCPLTKEFSNYFNSYYANRKQQWALCYRKYSHINTNMYVEAFHRVLKHIYMKGTINKRVDKCIHILMKFERDKGFERLVKLEKGKMTGRIEAIVKRHLASENLSVTNVILVSIFTAVTVQTLLFITLYIYICKHIHLVATTGKKKKSPTSRRSH